MDYKEKLKEALNSDNTDYEVVRWIEQNFPELKESEDERIGKELIEFVKSRGGFKQEYIAWIEEQANHANFRNKIQIGDKVTKNEDGVLVNLSQLKRVAKKDEKQGEQKPANKVEPKFKAGYTIRLKNGDGLEWTVEQIHDNGWCTITCADRDDCILLDDNLELVEQKLIDKVEPKFKAGDRVIGIVSGIQYYITEVRDDYYCTESGCIIMFNAQDNFEIDEQKPAWSEEDERKISDVIVALSEYANGNIPNILPTILLEDVEWLKSLRPPYHCDNCKLKKSILGWKPSDEQMNALNDVISSRDIKYDVLSELWKDLKKLTE